MEGKSRCLVRHVDGGSPPKVESYILCNAANSSVALLTTWSMAYDSWMQELSDCAHARADAGATPASWRGRQVSSGQYSDNRHGRRCRKTRTLDLVIQVSASS